MDLSYRKRDSEKEKKKTHKQKKTKPGQNLATILSLADIYFLADT